MHVAPLLRARLAEAELVLADACPFDRASEVADEKLFGPGPASAVQAFGAWDGDTLVGVAAVAARWLRVLAVVPRARRAGAGSALLAACEAVAKSGGQPKLSALDQPGNYLAPGIDERNTDAIAWLERRGWTRGNDVRTNVLLAVRGNPRVSEERAAELAAAASERGYVVRRARRDEQRPLSAAIAREFGRAWPHEVECALAFDPPAVHVATQGDEYVAFAAHDGNNRGLGWFGPTGTWAAHRGQKLGEALLMACLVDVAEAHAYCEVAWVGPRPFYEKVAGIASERRFVTMAKSFT